MKKNNKRKRTEQVLGKRILDLASSLGNFLFKCEIKDDVCFLSQFSTGLLFTIWHNYEIRKNYLKFAVQKVCSLKVSSPEQRPKWHCCVLQSPCSSNCLQNGELGTGKRPSLTSHIAPGTSSVSAGSLWTRLNRLHLLSLSSGHRFLSGFLLVPAAAHQDSSRGKDRQH